MENFGKIIISQYMKTKDEDKEKFLERLSFLFDDLEDEY